MILICAMADAPRIAVGSELRECEECGAAIMIAPSGLIRLASDPKTVAVCIDCGARLIDESPNPSMEFAASSAVMTEEIRTSEPNPRYAGSTLPATDTQRQEGVRGEDSAGATQGRAPLSLAARVPVGIQISPALPDGRAEQPLQE